MANICSNVLYVNSNDTKALESLNSAINMWQKGNFCNRDKNYPWLMENIIGYSGIDTYDKENDRFSHFSCRGEMGDSRFENNTLIISFSTAWNPDFSVWDAIFKKYLHCEYTVSYVSDEPGCELFLSNDSDYIGKYNIDVYDDIDGIEDIEESDDFYCASEETVYELCRTLLAPEGINLPIYREYIKHTDDYGTIAALTSRLDDFDIPVGIHKWDSEPYETFVF